MGHTKTGDRSGLAHGPYPADLALEDDEEASREKEAEHRQPQGAEALPIPRHSLLLLTENEASIFSEQFIKEL